MYNIHHTGILLYDIKIDEQNELYYICNRNYYGGCQR